MMKANKLVVIVFSINLFFLGTGCKKKTPGCMNTAATNYKPSAELEDGSCTFEGSATFWFDDTTGIDFQMNGVDALIIKLDGEDVGGLDVTQYLTSAPDCWGSDCVTVFKNMGNSASKPFPYIVQDGNGNLIWSGNIMYTANTCIKKELHY